MDKDFKDNSAWKRRLVNDILPLAVLMTAAFLIYANTFGHEWTLDDFPVIVENSDIRSFGDFFKNNRPGRPLREVTYLLDYSLFGLNPAGYHVQNVFWHGLNAALIYLLVYSLKGGKTVAWATSLLFLAHPIQVEVVANISHRKDSLALAFALLSTLYYIRMFGSSHKRATYILMTVLCALLAYLAKENTLVLPLIFIAYEIIFVPDHKKLITKHTKLIGGTFTLGLIMIFIYFIFHQGWKSYLDAADPMMAKMNVSLSMDNYYLYFLTVLKSWTFMFLKLLIPLGLSVEYVFSVPESWTDRWILSAIAGVVVYMFLIRYFFKRNPLACYAIIWLGLFWLPTSNIWPLSYFAADRYMYAPAVGFFLAVALIIDKAFSRVITRYVVIIILVAALAVITIRQNRVWSSPETLWSHAEKINPGSTTVLNNLGSIYMIKGEFDKSLVYFHRAASNYNEPMVYYNLASVYEKIGNTRKALYYYQLFLSFDDPRYDSLALELRRRLDL